MLAFNNNEIFYVVLVKALVVDCTYWCKCINIKVNPHTQCFNMVQPTISPFMNKKESFFYVIKDITKNKNKKYNY